ncbi:MAG TPA: GspH/FimT family pseudopilin [Thermodesulfobacteriota bacterium]|jgi:prepilin-type N-terminal cleavage/methylation domain-containing protein|nr:GspH/FimT family pseudopilin [Thermodesulfobacteriota bacterium]
MRERGFTLLEIIIVLTLFALSTLLVVPSLSRFSKGIELTGSAKKVSAILRYCRSEAVNKGKIYQVFFDTESQEVKVRSMERTEEGKGSDEKSEEKISEKKYALPSLVHIKEVKVGSTQYPSDLPAIEFYPTGGSNGGSVLLDSLDSKGYRINVNFLTGMVEIEKV